MQESAEVEVPWLALGGLDGSSGRRFQHRRCSLDSTRDSDSKPLSNRRMRTRMYGGVGAAGSNGRGYPIHAMVRWHFAAVGQYSVKMRHQAG